MCACTLQCLFWGVYVSASFWGQCVSLISLYVVCRKVSLVVGGGIVYLLIAQVCVTAFYCASLNCACECVFMEGCVFMGVHT